MKLASTTQMAAVYVGGEHVIVVTGMLPTPHHRVEVRPCPARASTPIFEVVCWPSAVPRDTTEYVAYLRAALGPQKTRALIVRDADGEREVALRELRFVAHDAWLATMQPNAGGGPLPVCADGRPPFAPSESDLWRHLVHEKPLTMTFSPSPEDAAGAWEMLRRAGLR